MLNEIMPYEFEAHRRNERMPISAGYGVGYRRLKLLSLSGFGLSRVSIIENLERLYKILIPRESLVKEKYVCYIFTSRLFEFEKGLR
jgi:hypothetical protein